VRTKTAASRRTRSLRRARRHLWPAAILIIAGCAGRLPLPPPAPDAPANLAAFLADWQAYTDTVNTLARQRDCIPRRVPANAAVARRGAVVMFHGYGGCPQQFFMLAERVAAQGFDVLLPLHPGHGLPATGDGGDDLSQLPQAGEAVNRYVTFAAEINRIMAQSPGQKIVVGFSLGGAVALNALLNAPGLYDRALLLSPMLAIRGGGVVESAVAIFGRLPGLRNLVVKPGGIRRHCHDWQEMGRAGFCDYRLRDTVALLELESFNERLYAARPPMLPIQFVIAGDEKYVSNPRIRKLAARQETFGPVGLYPLAGNVPHEMLSPYENTGRPMDWLGGLLGTAEDFIIGGRLFPADGERRGQCHNQRGIAAE